MAVDCTSSVLIPRLACYTQHTLTPTQQKALLIFAKMFVLKHAGGTDYTASVATALITDASRMICGATPDQLVAADIATYMEAAGGVVPALALGTKLANVACLVGLDDLTLDKINVFLNCNILAAQDL